MKLIILSTKPDFFKVKARDEGAPGPTREGLRFSYLLPQSM